MSHAPTKGNGRGAAKQPRRENQPQKHYPQTLRWQVCVRSNFRELEGRSLSLYVRLNTNFFTHRKTAKLRAILGNDALWLPPRIWAYAAENQPDGVFKDYTAPELASHLGYTKDAKRMLEALLQAGFLDSDPLRIHAWVQYNGYHVVFANRAKKAAEARWQKERTKEKVQEKRGEETSIASSMPQASGKTARGVGGRHPNPPEMWKLRKDLEDARKLLEVERQKLKPDQRVVQGLLAEIDGIKEAIGEYGSTRGRKPSRPVKDSKPVSASNVVSTLMQKTGVNIPHDEFAKGCEEARKAIEAQS